MSTKQPWTAVWAGVDHIPDAGRDPKEPEKVIRIRARLVSDARRPIHIDLEVPETDRLAGLLHKRNTEARHERGLVEPAGAIVLQLDTTMKPPWKAIWDGVEHIAETDRDPRNPARVVRLNARLDDDMDRWIHIDLTIVETDRLADLLHRRYIEALADKALAEETR